ncbi:MAG: diguanylate cyclase [Rhizobiaceae bacterium]|nr:diguanylate cyclase [Rhizobiaceae bacterium]
MSGGAFILAINLSVAGFLAAAFLAIAIYDPVRVSARWFALGYAFGAANFILEFAISFSGYGGALSVAAYAVFLSALVAFNAGIARLLDLRVPWRTVAAIALAGVAVRLAIDGMDRTTLLRMSFYQAPYAVMQAVGVWLVWSARTRKPLELLLLCVLALTTVHYMLKPFILRLSGGTGSGPETYLQTTYAMFSQTSGTILAFALALVLLVILVRNVLSDITTRSETDALSGLLNRRGFEERRDTAIRQKLLNGLPVALIACDLDHFKAVNDTLGHAAGDRVITAFGDMLRDNLLPHQTAGRIGGEEFAILLPGSNLAAARLFAESIRAMLAVAEIEGLDGRHFTASFGVAELHNGERAAEFEARADAALYAAKARGRDRVEVAANGMAAVLLRRASDRRR